VEIWRKSFAGLRLEYSLTPPNIGANYGPGWYAFAKCDGSQGTPDDYDMWLHFACQSLASVYNFYLRVVIDGPTAVGQWMFDNSLKTCVPFSVNAPTPVQCFGGGAGFDFCGESFNGTAGFSWFEGIFED